VGVAHELIEKAASLTYVPCHLRQALFALVQLFENRHGQIDVVLMETEYGRGIVHQHVGVEDEQAGLVVVTFDHRCAGRGGEAIA